MGRLCQARSKCLAKGDVTSRLSGPQKPRKYTASIYPPRSPRGRFSDDSSGSANRLVLRDELSGIPTVSKTKCGSLRGYLYVHSSTRFGTYRAIFQSRIEKTSVVIFSQGDRMYLYRKTTAGR